MGGEPGRSVRGGPTPGRVGRAPEESAFACPECGIELAVYDHSEERAWHHLLAATFDEDGGVTLDEDEIGVFVLIVGDAVSCWGASKQTRSGQPEPSQTGDEDRGTGEAATTASWPSFAHRITSATAEGLNSRIQAIRVPTRGYRSRENFKAAIYFHLGGLDFYPKPA